jgi:hypothetical protein
MIFLKLDKKSRTINFKVIIKMIINLKCYTSVVKIVKEIVEIVKMV